MHHKNFGSQFDSFYCAKITFHKFILFKHGCHTFKTCMKHINKIQFTNMELILVFKKV